jgi:uncharacterized protein involved in outer membrane biogenesis
MAPPSSPRGRKLAGVLLLILVVLVAGVAAGEILGWPFLRGPLERELAQRLERPVRIAPPFRVRFLGPLRLEAGQLWIAAPTGFDVPHLVDAQQLAMKLRYRDLAAAREGAPLRIAALTVGRLDAQLVRKPDGSATWQGPRHGGEEGKVAPPPPRVDQLVVGAGEIVLQDAPSGVDLSNRFDTREGEAAELPVTHIASSGKFAKRPLRAELTTPGLLAVASGGQPEQALPARGWIEYGGVRVDFDGSVTDIFGERRLDGAVVVKGPSLAVFGELVGSVLPTSPPFLLKGRIRSDPPVWHLQVDTARVGSSQLAGQFSFDPSPPRAQLNGELRGRRFVLADLAPAFGTRSPEGKKLAPPPGRALPDRPLDLPSLKTMDAHVSVDLQYVDLGSAFAQPITPLKGKLTLEEGRLALDEVTANTARGSLSGSIAVDANQQPPRWQGDLAWRGIRLEDWLKVSRSRSAEDPEGQAPPYFTGHLQGRVRFAGQGNSTAQLLASLDGEGTVSVRDGSMSHLVVEALGLDVAQGLGLMLTGDEALPLRCAVVDVAARQGRVSPRVAMIDTPVTLVMIDGSADLAQERLDLRLVARPTNVSPLTLRSPLRVQGSFVAPKVRPEPVPIAARLAGALLLGSINPLAAVLPFLDPGESGESPCAQTLAQLRR